MKTYIRFFTLWTVLAALFIACDKGETTKPAVSATPGGTTKSSAKAINLVLRL